MNIKNTLKALLISLVVLLVPSFVSAQTGTALTQTTLSATIGAGQTAFQLASVTNISGFGAGINSPTGGTVANGNLTDLYIDRELMQVIAVNTTAKTVVVLRGQGGSQVGAHASGTMVLAAAPGAFFNYDPSGFCGTLTATQGAILGAPPQFATWVNQRTGAQWICSTVTKTWVPGFSQFAGYSSGANAVTTAVASAAGTVTPSGPLFHITGALAITGFVIPVGCNATAVGGCSFTVIPDGTFTWTAAGNIALAGTAVVNKSITFTWDATNSKWVPSVIA
jgi:3D (Asp-Asp-Asp) domain-containing protein